MTVLDTVGKVVRSAAVMLATEDSPLQWKWPKNTWHEEKAKGK